MSGRLGFVHIGPHWHGVTRFGRQLEQAVQTTSGNDTAMLALAPGSALHGHRPAATDVWFGQFTDHLWASSPDDAVAAVRRLAEAVAPARLVITLHDLPRDPHDTARRRAYRTVAELADAVVVCSAHEAARLHGCGYTGSVDVVPHFVEGRPCARPARGDRLGGRREVGVLGFVYPGKGHSAALRAVAAQRRPARLVVLGRASPGHEQMVDELVGDACALGVPCAVTGWIAESALDAQLGEIDVPVAPYEAISASSSIATWLAAGRRPIVRRGPYVDELLARAPGSVTPYDPADPGVLGEHIARALDDPASTYHDGLPEALSLRSFALSYMRLPG